MPHHTYKINVHVRRLGSHGITKTTKRFRSCVATAVVKMSILRVETQNLIYLTLDKAKTTKLIALNIQRVRLVSFYYN